MKSEQNQIKSAKSSYWHAFRIIFVIFCLYLAGDAYHRWSGFRFYSTFSNFLPGVTLITILWSVVAVVATFLLWFPFRAIELISLHDRWSKTDRLLLFIYVFFSLSAITMIGNRKFVSVELSYQLKLAVFSSVVLITLLITIVIERFSIWFKWKYLKRSLHFILAFVLSAMFILVGYQIIWKNAPTPAQLAIVIGVIVTTITLWLRPDRTARWIGILQDRITIWVWLFSIWLLLSVPLVAYYAWIDKPGNNIVPSRTIQTTKAYKNRPNIILITFDELTSLDMSAYGYHRDTTPFISEWAKEALLFSKAKVSDPSTAQSTTSLMTGKRVWNHRVFQTQAYKVYNEKSENIPLLLKQNGYHNMAYMSAEYSILEGSSISNLFDIYHSPPSMFKKEFNPCISFYKGLYLLFGKRIKLYDWILKLDFILQRFLSAVKKSLLGIPFGYCNIDFRHDTEKQFDALLEDIDNAPPEPFFAWTHLWPPHQPYLPPEPYDGMFVSSLELKKNNFSLNDNALVNRARYDEYIRYADEQFRKFIQDSRLRNKLKNTVIILSSDHGMHPNTEIDLSEIRVSIPLIIKIPDNGEGQVINDLVEQIDIPATILDLAHIPLPEWMEGRSLLPLMHGRSLPPKHIFSMHFPTNQVWDRITKGSVAVWESDYKLIHYLEEDKSLLFNLKEDPDESRNLFHEETEIGQRLLRLVLDNLEKANENFLAEK
jgi:arylsulfatase A-like enzyme